MKSLFLPILALPLLAVEPAHLTYSKSFPGSIPAYETVTVDRAGAAVYKEAEDDDFPRRFQLSSVDTQALFAAAESLGYFDHPLESGLKVAFTGDKIFRYDDGQLHRDVKFNYSQDPTARSLVDWFERICESERLYNNLETAAKYDKLGVMKAVSMIDAANEDKRLVNGPQFLPLLDRIAKNESYMHQARLRAAALTDQIRAAK